MIRPLESTTRGPVAVAVQRDAEVGPLGHHASRQFGQVGVHGRIGLVPGKIGIDGTTQRDDLAAGLLQHARRDVGRGAPIASRTIVKRRRASADGSPPDNSAARARTAAS